MKILIATDGSACSQNAIEEFCRMFEKAENVDIKIAAIYEGIIPLDALGVANQNVENTNLALQQKAEEAAFDAMKYISERIPQAKIETIVAMDLAQRFILERAAGWEPHLIVVGSHNRGFWGRMVLGSVSDAVIHNAPTSVLLARHKLRGLN